MPRDAKLQAAPAVEVGDFFIRTYGYDQTNVDFFKVVGFTKSGKSARVQRWSKSVVSGLGGPQEDVVPGQSPAVTRTWKEDYSDMVETVAPVVTKRLVGANLDMLSWDSYSYCRRWDGRPAYQTGPGWGH